MKKIKNIIISIFLFVIVSCSGLAFFNVSLFSGASSIAEVEKGGAVYLQNDATYTMKGGSIKNKTATYGGAVYVSDGTVFNMQGGEISGNLADYGSGIYVESGGTYNMSGGTMADDVYTAGSMVYTGGTVSGNITLAGSENLTIGAVPEEPLNVTAQTTAVGTKLIKVTASGFELSDINITGLPTGRRVIISNGYVVVDYVYYTITWKNADGTVLETDTVAHGTTPTYDGATPTKASTAQYSYAFKSWDSTVVAATANKTYTATYTATTRSYVVTIGVSPSGYGSVSKTSVTVPYGTSISASGATLTVGSNTITASATAATAQYTYAFSSWTDTTGTITGTKTILANFTRTVNRYTVTLGTGYGSWDTSTAITVDYGTAISASSNKLTVGSTTRTFTKSANTDQYTYTFNSLSGVPSGGTVVGNVTITPSVTRTTNQYTVTLGTGYGSWDTSAAITVDYGTAISVSSNKLTVGSTTRTWTTSTDTAQYDYTFNSLSGVPSGGTVIANVTITPSVSRATKTYTVTWKNHDGTVLETDTGVAYGTTPTYNGSTPTKAATAQYTYTFSGWTPAVAGITGATTYTAGFSSTVNRYTVTLGTGYGSWDTSTAITVDYGTAISASSNKLTVGSTTRTWTTTATTAQYSYTFNSLSGVPSGGTVVANVTITPSVTRTLRSYTVTLGSGHGSWDTSTAITATYGTAISVSSNKLTVGSTTRTWTTSTDTAQYDYTFSSLSGVPSGGTVVGNVTITPNVTRVTKSYTVTIAVNNSGYGSVDKTSVTVNYGTSISASGATLTVGSNTIKATATAATAQYTYAFSSWTGASGTVTGTKTITANFTRITNQYTVTLGTGYGSWDTSTAITVDYGTAISVSSNKLTVGSTTRTWTTSATTAQYSYAFNSLSGVPSGGTVVANVTITPSVTRTLRSYTVTLASGYGSWDNSAAFSATYGTSISISSNKVTVGSTTRTFTASADTAQYDYTFTSLSKSTSASTITGAVTITPNVSRVTKTYTLSYSNGYYYATNATDITVTASRGTLSRSTINSSNSTFTLTAEYSTEPITITFTRKNTNRDYMVWWTGTDGSVNTVSRTWTPTSNESNSWYVREYFTATARAGTGISSASFAGTGCWGEAISATTSARLLYGASLKFSASVSTGYTWSKWSDGSTTQTNYAVTTLLNKDIDLTASATINKYTVTWKNHDGTTLETDTGVSYGTTPTYNGSTPTKSSTAQYSYSFSGWSPAVAAITGATTYTAQFSATTRTYTVTWKNHDGTTLETDTGVAYGTKPTYNGSTPTRASTAQYSYSFSGWSPAVAAITGATTYTAQFSATTRTYTVTWKNGSTTLETDTGVAYGTTPTYNGATPTKSSTAQYSYTFSGWSPSVGAITGATTYTAQFTATTRTYTVTWKNYDGTTLETDTGVAYGTTPTYNGNTPTRSTDDNYHYTFSGWSPTVAAITGATTYTAQFSTRAHTYEDFISTIAPTCTAQGYDKYECNWCTRYVYKNYTAATGHTTATSYGNGYTSCTTTGFIKTYCSVCNVTISNSSYSSHAQGTYYTNDATCTYKGYDKYYCSRKGDGCTGQVSVARSSYDTNYHYEYVGGPAYSTYTSVITAATCTSTGTMGTYCSGCNALKSTSSIPKIDHTTTTSYGNGYTSCTTDGFIRTYCSSCNTTISTSSYSSHAQGTYKSNDATCTYKGYNYYYCSRKSDGCTGETSAARSSYDTSYHYQSVGGTAWGTYSKVITAATCSATGTMGTYCSGCDAQRSTSTIAKDSSNHTDLSTSEGLATYCTTTGYISTYCYACNTTVSNSRYSSHSYGDYYTTTAATCSSTGVQRANCTRSNCSGYKTATIAKDSSNHSNITTQSGLTTNCTTSGYIKQICTDCDTVISSSRYTSHSYGYWKTTTAATCTTTGTKKYYCSRTGCTTYNQTQTIAALGHDYSVYVSTSKHKCSRCTQTKAHVFLTNAQGYQVCDMCGYNTGIMLNFAPTTNNSVCDGVDCGVSKYYQSETILTKKETAILNKDEDDLIIMD